MACRAVRGNIKAHRPIKFQSENLKEQTTLKTRKEKIEIGLTGMRL
jgi:hypothetical protein